MTYRDVYDTWLSAPALTDDERAELQALAQDETELRSRFYGMLEFGTAGFAA
jgi:phosphoglucomutase